MAFLAPFTLISLEGRWNTKSIFDLDLICTNFDEDRNAQQNSIRTTSCFLSIDLLYENSFLVYYLQEMDLVHNGFVEYHIHHKIIFLKLHSLLILHGHNPVFVQSGIIV